MSNLSDRQAEVRQLAREAGLAEQRERAFRAGFVESGRRVLTGGKVVIVAGLAGLVVLALRRPRGEDGGSRSADDSPSLLARVGMFTLAIFRWRTLASDVLHLFEPSPRVTESDEGVSEA